MKRRRFIAGLAVLTAVVVATVLLWPRGPRPCRATFEQVREGMSREEVIATVGGPPRDYTGGRSLSYLIAQMGIRPGPETWAAEDADLNVYFDDADRASEVRISDPTLRPAAPLFDRLCDRLGL